MHSNYALDPELGDQLAALPKLDGPDIRASRQNLADAMSRLPEPDSTGVIVERREVPGSGSEQAVPVIVYRPDHQVKRACVVDVHGGGFTMGSAAMNHAANIGIVRRLGAPVVSVDYRLAPEHPFPAALDDCYSALRWAQSGGHEDDAGEVSIALHGFSAGAGLCAALALLARDNDGPPIAFQYLGCPLLDDRLETRSMREFTNTPMWTRSMTASSWRSYLGTKHTSDAPKYAAPGRAEDLSGLPPTYISVMTFDPLRDEGIAYAQRLLEGGVPTELHLFPGTFHGSNLIHRAAISRRETIERIEVLRRGLSMP
ncbi:alpha/beta hydrolase [Rhodococcus fascians]|nr:alpha/beta hydrolase [Rhodococcus fascians]MBY3999952.1 alpha/beta hydrolase [Rhodococcus fascians]MBY4005135.1 alpha/beta hydrolase [Rhodococcus fascians]MBY4010306.1 alpha/beta hydrolase [Rhodococcus fascians]MBY4020349.1 alpha/beta hydrolase [Rhodococcus fascians]